MDGYMHDLRKNQRHERNTAFKRRNHRMTFINVLRRVSLCEEPKQIERTRNTLYFY